MPRGSGRPPHLARRRVSTLADGGGSGVGRRPRRPAAMFSEPVSLSPTTVTITFSEPTVPIVLVRDCRFSELILRSVLHCPRRLRNGIHR